MTITKALANHLWQTTVVWLLLWAMMPLLRQNSAAVRSRLWLVSSLKFLFPFALLSWASKVLGHMHGTRAAISAEFVSGTAQRVEAPFDHGAVPGLSPTFSSETLVTWHASYAAVLICLWVVGAAWVAIPWVRQWIRLRRMVQEAEPIGSLENVRLVMLRSATEPAVFGFFQPTLLLPLGIEQRLNLEQMEGVLAHELCHVRRRDNLKYALHTLVTTVFWFHPAVWVIRTHLLRERELACDEAVLSQGRAPDLYAESILKVCRWYLEAAPECMAGISGTELKDRVRRILAAHPAMSLNLWRKVLLLVIAVGVTGLPMGMGLIEAEQGKPAEPSQLAGPAAMGFEVSTIKPSRADARNSNVNFTLGRFSTENISLEALLKEAYGLNSGSNEQIVGIPGWVRTSDWDINAKEEPATAAALDRLPFEQRIASVQPMLQALLGDRFKLRAHIEVQPRIVSAILIAKGGSKLQAFAGCSGVSSDPPCNPKEWQGLHNDGHGHIEGRGATLAMLANMLAAQTEIGGRMVVDDTGLAGKFNFDLQWTSSDANGADNSGASLFTALQEQLGLKLDTKKLPIKVLIVDHVEKPTPN